MERFTRTEHLIGSSAIEILKSSRIAVFGVGGVGGYVCEALARSGTGAIDLIDPDVICESNINRQIIALGSTLGKYKADVMRERIIDINPDCVVNSIKIFFLPENSVEFDFTKYNYIVDAIDTISAKIELAVQAKLHGIRIISSMGTGNKLDPGAFEVSDIYETSVCPLARVMRRELRAMGIEQLKVIYSKEPPRPSDIDNGHTPASISFVPPAAGLMIASEVIKDLTGIR